MTTCSLQAVLGDKCSPSLTHFSRLHMPACLPASHIHSPWKGVERLRESCCQAHLFIWKVPKVPSTRASHPACLTEPSRPASGTGNLDSHFIAILKKKSPLEKSNTMVLTVTEHCLSESTGKRIGKSLQCAEQCVASSGGRGLAPSDVSMRYHSVGLQRFLSSRHCRGGRQTSFSAHTHRLAAPGLVSYTEQKCFFRAGEMTCSACSLHALGM